MYRKQLVLIEGLNQVAWIADLTTEIAWLGVLIKLRTSYKSKFVRLKSNAASLSIVGLVNTEPKLKELGSAQFMIFAQGLKCFLHLWRPCLTATCSGYLWAMELRPPL